MPSGTPWWPSPARTMASMARKRIASASGERVDEDMVVTSTEPALDARAKRFAADAVAVVQGGQRTRVEKCIGQAGELKARGLHAMAQQRAGHRFTEAAD